MILPHGKCQGIGITESYQYTNVEFNTGDDIFGILNIFISFALT